VSLKSLLDPRSAGVAAGLGAIVLARRWYLHWGSAPAERHVPLPGDDLIPRADLTVTRAITINTTPAFVWPWLAQLGQGRGGFYTYDFLENLVGLHMHSAERIFPEWQDLAIGDEVKLHPQGGMIAAVVKPPRALVLRGGIPMRNAPAPFDFTWAFVLDGRSDGTTRLIVRERYAYTQRWTRLIVEPVEVISFIMSQRMLRGIKVRAERAPSAGGSARRDQEAAATPPTLTESSSR
jgi:hypothetical protein